MSNVRRYKVFFHESAFAELKNIVNYVAETNDFVAQKIKNKIISQCLSLQNFPYRYPFYEGGIIREKTYHKMVVLKKYLVFYQVVEESLSVYIDVIVDGKQNYEWLL